MPNIVFMYSGLGSQYYQMGKNLFTENNVFKDELLKADQLYQQKMGFSLLDRFYNDSLSRSEPFLPTLLTIPAIFMIECALTQVLIKNGIVPNMVLGASMGECAAAVAAGILDFESAFDVLIKQAQLLESQPAGGMLAIIAKPNLYQSLSNCELAGINFDSHFVISGTSENLNLITAKLNKDKIANQMLWVTKGFHSHLIDGAKPAFLETLKILPINKAKIPFISCVRTTPTDSVVAEDFWKAMREPIMFQDSIREIENQQPTVYIDVGPSGTLATFAKYNIASLSQSKTFPLLSLFGNDNNNLKKMLDVLNNL